MRERGKRLVSADYWPRSLPTTSISTRSMPVNQDPASPNFLAFLSYGLDEANEPGRRNNSESSVAKADKLQARTLDSLAYILVGRESSQVVAVGALLPPDGSSDTAINLLVSENNNVLDPTSSHLNHVLELLRVIHDYPPTMAEDIRISTFEPKEEATDYVQQFITLETALIKYCAPKLAKRYRKDSRNTNFMESLADLSGLPAHERDDLTQTQRDLLKTFQATVQKVTRSNGRPWLEDDAGASLSAARYLDEHLLSASKGDAGVLEDVRSALHSLHHTKKVLDQPKHREFFIDWNAYIDSAWFVMTSSCEVHNSIQVGSSAPPESRQTSCAGSPRLPRSASTTRTWRESRLRPALPARSSRTDSRSNSFPIQWLRAKCHSSSTVR